MNISLKQIFYGFVNNFVSLKLDRYDFYYSGTKHTVKILNYFATLGEYLGFVVDLERSRYDLIWIPIDQKLHPEKTDYEIYLHMESELSGSLEKAEDEFNALLNSRATNLLIGLFFLDNKNTVSDWITRINTLFEQSDKNLLFILSPMIYDSNIHKTDYYGHIKENGVWKTYHIEEPWLNRLEIKEI